MLQLLNESIFPSSNQSETIATYPFVFNPQQSMLQYLFILKKFKKKKNRYSIKRLS